MESKSEQTPLAPERRSVAILAGGCFWCLEAVYELVHGVESVLSGYCGGSTPNPSYEEVCSGTTGHAEALKVTFYPEAISYSQILEIFFSIHDPTTLNRQGPDVGSQYRSAIYYTDLNQQALANAYIKQLENEADFYKPIVTEVVPLTMFYQAEEHHQKYYKRNSAAPYCQMVIVPKLNKFLEYHREKVSY